MKKFKEKFKEFDSNFIETSRDEDLLLTKSFIMSWLKKYFSTAAYDIHFGELTSKVLLEESE